MKKIQKPKVLVLSLVALMVLFLCGCAPQRSQMENIGATQAKNVALADAGLVESQVGVVNTELSQRDGMSYYTVSFTAEGKRVRIFWILSCTLSLLCMSNFCIFSTPFCPFNQV